MKPIRALLTIATVLFVLPVVVAAQTEPGAPVLKKTPTKTTTTKRTTTRKVVKPKPVYVASGTELKVRLNDTLSSKESRVGDKFTVTVLDPDRYDEATVRGHISSIKKSGKIKGNTSMNLAFESITLSDGRKGVLHGYVTKVYGSGSGKADDEGGVESSGRGKQTAKRTGIGAAAGAIIGGIAGGGSGAAIGLLIGGAGGAGSLAIKGSKELKIESGTELLVRVTK